MKENSKAQKAVWIARGKRAGCDVCKWSPNVTLCFQLASLNQRAWFLEGVKRSQNVQGERA